MNPYLLVIIFASYLADVNCHPFQTLLPGDPLQKLNTTESSFGAIAQRRDEILRRRSVMFYYTFAALGVFIIIGILLYFISISGPEFEFNGRYEAKYTAPVKKNKLTVTPNVGGISTHPPNKASTSKSSGDAGGDEYWWDDDQEVYSSEMLMRSGEEIFRV